MTDQTITYEQVAWMQPVKDRSGKIYFMLGKVTNPGIKNTLAVTPKDGKGMTMFYCLEHETAYGINGACLDCRTRVVG
jgi:hypothetical protein